MKNQTFKLLREYVDLKGIAYFILANINNLFAVLLYSYLGAAIDSLVKQDFESFLFYLLITFVCTLLSMFSSLLSIFIYAAYQVSLSTKLREKVSLFLVNSETPHSIEEAGGSGAVVPWFTGEVGRMSSVIFAHLSLFNSSIRLMVLFLVLGISNLYLLVIFILFLVLYLLIPLIVKNYNQRLGKEYQILAREEYSKSLDIFKSISTFLRVLKGFSFMRRVLGITKSFAIKNFRLMVKETAISTPISTLSISLLLFLELVNGILVYQGLLSFSTFVVATAFFGKATGSLDAIKSSRMTIHQDSFLFKRFDDLPLAKHSKSLPKFEVLKITSLSFAFSQKEIFSNFDLKLERGQKIAIVGASGVGKTTLARIICGWIDNFRGEITWGEIKVIDSPLKEITHNIFLLNSEPQILEATLEENITLFAPLATQKEIRDLLNFFNLDYFDLNSLISKQTISKGEAQRIALVRALLIKKEILILDESLSGVDKLVRDKIESWLLDNKDLTLINITHRLALEKKYNQVIRLA